MISLNNILPKAIRHIAIVACLILICIGISPVRAVVLGNNCYMNTSTTGTGTLTLTTAVSGGQSFLDCGITNGQVVRYRIFNGAAWEVGSGTYTTAGTTLSRAVLESSNADAAVSLTAGATVIITPLTQDLPSETTTIDSTLVPASDYFLVMEGGSVLERALIATQMASTTEALTGTATDRFMTPDSTAAIWEKGSNVASAGTTTLGEGYLFHITGTTTITDIDWTTAKDGRCAVLIFDGILTLTHNATTLILPGNANIITAVGDELFVCQDSSDNVIGTNYQRQAATSNAAINVQTMTATGSGDSWDKPTGGQRLCRVQVWGAGGSGGKGAAAAAAGGGGGGAYRENTFALSALAATETVTIGTGGAAQTVASTAGNVGGNSQFGSSVPNLMFAYGGGGGGSGATGSAGGGGGGAGAPGGGGGTGITGGTTDSIPGGVGNLTVGPYGAPGGNGVATGNAIQATHSNMGGAGGGGATGDATGTNSSGGNSLFGGGGGGAGAEDSAPGAGIASGSYHGGAGGAGAFDAGVGSNGTQPGGGGGGSETGNSGAGGNGKAVITCW